MRMRNSARLHGLWLTLVAALVLPGKALAGWGDDNWGAMMWNEIASPPVLPALGIVGLTLLAMGLAATAAWTLRKRRPALGVTLSLVLLAIPLAVAAGTLTVPHTFVNGTVADADDVNANFDAAETAVNDNDSRITAAQGTANTAVTNAAAAQSTANTAVTNAAAAQTTANTAVTNAAAAQGTADAAVTNAAVAQTTANTAATDATAAQGTANTAVANAATAQTTAGTAASNAAAAQTTANTAVANAATAQSTASSAQAILSSHGPHDRPGIDNTAVGVDALLNNTTGYSNTAIGYRALEDNTTGHENTSVGMGALQFNTTGFRNTASGRKALYSNTTGFYNTATGDGALYSNTTGSYNAATGDLALHSNTTGYYNTAMGPHTLQTNSTGSHNTATGRGALNKNWTGSFNTATGSGALFYNTTGSNNVATGRAALNRNTIGGSNTATGRAALNRNTIGGYNTALGRSSLFFNTEGSYNTAVGRSALAYNILGSNNIAVGHLSAYNTTGSDNIMIGNEGLGSDVGMIRIGTPGTHTVTELSGSVVITDGGAGAIRLDGTAVTSGYGLNLIQDDEGIKLGHTSPIRDIQFQTDSTTRMTIEGDGVVKLDHSSASYDVWIQGGSSAAAGNARNLAILGLEDTDTLVLNYGGEYTSGTEIQSDLTVSGCITGSFCSDARLKVNIQSLDEPVLDEVLQLQASTYQWRDDLEKGTQIGLIAQEVEKVFPELVTTGSEGLQKGLSCTGLNAVTIQAVKELKAEKDAEIAALKQRLALVEQLSARLAKLEAQVGADTQVVQASTTSAGG